MGKILRPLAVVAAIAVNVIPGIGQAASAAILGLSAGAKAIAIGAAVITAAVTIAGGLALQSMQGATRRALSRLNLSFDPEAPRGIWLGETAANTDMVYQEASGTDQEFIDTVIVLAGHGATSIDAIYTEDKLMWTSAGGAQGDYVGYVTVTPVLKGVSGAGVAINGGSKWGANASLTGCAYLVLRIKRTGNNKKAESPFAAGLPPRMTIVGKGAAVYDPRRDSTVGGSGPHRANDETTWQYADGSTVLGTNPALQLLTFLLGWRIGGVVSVGVGVPANRINMADFIAAANICDESVTTSDGTQRRYETAGVFNDEDAPSAVADVLCQSMNAAMRDTGGRIGIRMRINDTAGTLLELTEADVLGEHTWEPQAPLNSSFNIVRGRFVDPSVQSLYQLAPYGERSVASPDGIPRAQPLDLPLVQNAFRAQRIAEQVLRRQQRRGTFVADFGPRAWACEVGQPVRLSFPATGFASKLFRVERQSLKVIFDEEGARAFCPMVLVEDDASVYAWGSADEGGFLPAVAPVSYLPSNIPFLLTQGADVGVDNGATRNAPRGTYSASETYVRGDLVLFSGSTYQLIVGTSTGNDPPDAAFWTLVAAAGSGPPGADGQAGVSVIVTNESAIVPTATDGSGGDYTSAGGQMKLLRGTTVLSPTFSIAAQSPAGGWITINSSTGVYTVTDPGQALATATLRANIGGVDYDRTYTLVQGRQGVAGPNLQITASSQGFIFLDNAASPASQTITITAALTNLSGTASFSTSPSVTLGGSGNSRTLTIADFGSNRQVTVEATLGGLTDRITIVRLDRSTAEAGANVTAPANANRVRFSRFERGVEGWVLGSADGLALLVEQFEFQSLPLIKGNWTATNSVQVVGIEQQIGSGFDVTPGERLSAQAQTDAAGAVLDWNAGILFDFDSGPPAYEAFASGVGPVSLDDVEAGFVVVPANARRGRLAMFAASSGAGAISLAIAHPMVTAALAGQTIHPPFSLGPNAVDGADPTRDVVPALQRGDWLDGRVYRRGDLTLDRGSTWAARVNHTASSGNRPPSTSWEVVSVGPDRQVASAGVDFTTGDTSYGSPAAQFTVRTGSAGQVALTTNTSAGADPNNTAGYLLAAKWQRWNGSSWVDVAAEMLTGTLNPGDTTPFNVAMTATGLTTNTDFDFRLLVRRAGAGPGSDVVTLFGTGTGVGS